ncbi:MAG: Spy/CpxP family protein refolding chaperone [Bdellovibrionales bacterium]
MRSNLLKKVAQLAVVVSSCLALTACHSSPEERAKKISKKITKKLDLNEDQQKKLKVLSDKAIAILQRRYNGANTNISEIKKMIISDRLDKKALDSMLENRKLNMQKNYDEMIDLVIEFHASLNSDQKQKSIKFIEKFEKKMKRYRKHK